MIARHLQLASALLLSLSLTASATTRYVDLNSTNATPPYTNWDTAAVTIQDAIDVADPGDHIWVTDGVYATGGRVAPPSFLTNRVVVDKAVTLQSVNGPEATIIQGYQVPNTTLGDSAVRCAYLVEGASLDGFTLTNGATGPDPNNTGYGGAVLCLTTNGNVSTNALVSNCVIISNWAGFGGGTCGSTLSNSAVVGNSAKFLGSAGGEGGGAWGSVLKNCTVTGNRADYYGGGANKCTLSNCTLTSNTAFYGGGADNCSLVDSALTGNAATYWGGGVFNSGLVSCTLRKCTLNGNVAFNGGGAASASTLSQLRLYDCVLTGNVATNCGGGAYGDGMYSCTLSNCILVGNFAFTNGGGASGGSLLACTLSSNSAVFGGGAASASLTNCKLTSNSAWLGGAAYLGTLKNCVLNGNSAQYGGAAGGESPSYICVLNNCTLTGNTACSGGGAYYARLNNCIIYYNSAFYGPNYRSASLNYCCTTPLPSGTGNIADEPQLASASRLSAGSPCRGAGNAASATGTDFDGEPWANPPSIGCDEFYAAAVTGALSMAIEATFTNVATGFQVQFTAQVDGRVSVSRWEFDDGSSLSNRPHASRIWRTAGDYPVVLRAYNESYPDGVTATAFVHVVEQPVHYVALDSTNPVAPYLSWATAATNIQDAVDASSIPGALVLVNDGVYQTGGRIVSPLLATNRLAVTKPVTVQSVNGPEATVIKGYQVPGTTNGNTAVRCVYLDSSTMLSGFTVTNGATLPQGDYGPLRGTENPGDWRGYGGGLWCASPSAVVSNCVIAGNAAAYKGGGIRSGTLVNCKLNGNFASNGGAAFYGALTNCTLSSNFAAWAGGGAYESDLYNCKVWSNSAGSLGGGTYHGKLDNSTLVGNLAATNGGGAFGGAFYNSILYYNTAPTNPNFYSGSPRFCCTTPLPASGTGNITNEPLFVDYANGNLRLQSNSPCINAGTNFYAPSGPDLDGNPRIVAGTVDMGAYEHQSPALTPFFSWQKGYGLPTYLYADADTDGMSDLREWVCGTDPTNAASVLRLLTPGTSASGLTVAWESVTNRSYFLERGTNMSGQPPFSLLATNLTGQLGTTSYTDTNAPGSRLFYYRVGVQ